MKALPPPESVPRYRVTLHSSSSARKHLVFIFAYNEGERLRDQLRRFPSLGERNFDLMIGDDGSTDGSIDEKWFAEHGVRGVTRLERNHGLSPNIKAGLHYVLNETEYQSVIMMNGNNKDDPGAIPRFIQSLEAGADYVQGSRFMAEGGHCNTPFVRHAAIRLVHAPLFSLSARRWMTDTTNGYRAFSRRFLLDSRVHPFQEAFGAYEIEQY